MLYISNSTRQIQLFYYRLPEEKPGQSPRMEKIMPGHQIALGSRWTKGELDYVIEQLDRSGARPKNSVKAKMHHFHGLLYSTDEPVSREAIEIGHSAVIENAEIRSAAEAVKGAAALDVIQRGPGGKRKAKTTSVEIVEEVPPNTKPKGNEINMSVEISQDGPTLKIPD